MIWVYTDLHSDRTSSGKLVAMVAAVAGKLQTKSFAERSHTLWDLGLTQLTRLLNSLFQI